MPNAHLKPTVTFKTREQWLQAAIKKFRVWFKAQGHELPATVRVSCGFTSGGYRAPAIGECWYPAGSADHHHEIFIKPDQDDPVRVLDIVLHELCHVALGHDAGHGKDFRALATKMGLAGHMTATVASEPLKEKLTGMAALLGPYPHARLSGTSAHRKPPQRHPTFTNVRCPEPECAFMAKVRNDQRHMGAVSCPIHHQPLRDKHGVF